jgi:uncharacterized protein
MIEAGKYYKLKIVKKVDFGLYLDAEGEEILLPKRFVPAQAKEGDEVEVFIYHDNEGRPIATTQKANAAVGEIALMKVVGKTEHGAFLDWGLMKDLFLPLSQQVSRIHEGISYLVYIYIDEQTGRVAATERIDKYLKNDELTVQVNEPVDLMVWQKTDIGYKMIINNKHTGVLHFSDVFRELEYGEKLKGFIKTIREENKIDVAIGEKGYARVVPETDKIIQLLKDNNGYLPYSDKSSPEEIYSVFGISKKTFKMALGALYKERKLELTKTGIKLIG